MNYNRHQPLTIPIENMDRDTIDLDALINTPADKQNFPSVRWMDMVIGMTKSLQDTNEKGQWLWNIDPMNIAFNQQDHSITYQKLGSSALTADKDQKKATCDPINKNHPNKDNIAPELKDASKKQVVCDEKSQVYGLGKVMAKIFQKQMKNNELGPAVRQSIADFLKKMTSPDPKQRPTLEQVKEFYSDVRKNLLNTPALLNHVVLLNVNEYVKAGEETHRRINNALKKAHVHEVWLYDSRKNGDSQLDYRKAVLRLQEYSLSTTVNKQVIMLPEKSKITDIAKIYSISREQKNNNLYVCDTINLQGEITYPENVSIKHLEKIIQSLESDLARVMQKYPHKHSHQARKGALSNAIAKLNRLKENGLPIKYEDLMKDLNRLQIDLTSKHLFRRVLSNITDSTFHASRENVKQLIQGIEETSAPRPKQR